MADRRKIEERIRKKEQEIQSLEDQIKDAKVYIQAMQDVLKMFPKEAGALASPDATLRAGSSVAQTRDLILNHGSPMHISDILRGLGKDLNKENRAALGGSIAAYVRRGEIFTRPAPNTFGLIELANKEPPPAAPSPIVPPASFGNDDDEEIPF